MVPWAKAVEKSPLRFRACVVAHTAEQHVKKCLKKMPKGPYQFSSLNDDGTSGFGGRLMLSASYMSKYLQTESLDVATGHIVAQSAPM